MVQCASSVDVDLCIKMPLGVLHTSQIGHTMGVDLKLVTFQMLADERQQCVQDSHCPCYCRW